MKKNLFFKSILAVIILTLVLSPLFGCGSQTSLSLSSESVPDIEEASKDKSQIESQATEETLEITESQTSVKEKELKQILNIYVWEGYLPEKAVKMFEDEAGIKLNISLVSDNGTMIALLEGGGKADIIMPTQNQVNRLYEKDLAMPIDLNKIPNYKNISDAFKNQPWSMWNGKELGSGDTYVIPYVFGTSGIIINTNKYKEPITENIGWDILFKEELKGRVSSKNSAESIMICLDVEGIPRSELLKNPEKTLEKVRSKVLDLKRNVLKFYDTGAEVIDLLKNEEVWVSHIWDGGGRKLMSSDSKFIYLLPKTGGLGWTDTFMIPKNADNPEGALKFIDFMLRPEVAAIVTEEGNTTTVSDAIKIADIENKELFELTDEQISKLIWQPNFPQSVIDTYTVFWEEILTLNE